MTAHETPRNGHACMHMMVWIGPIEGRGFGAACIVSVLALGLGRRISVRILTRYTMDRDIGFEALVDYELWVLKEHCLCGYTNVLETEIAYEIFLSAHLPDYYLRKLLLVEYIYSMRILLQVMLAILVKASTPNIDYFT